MSDPVRDLKHELLAAAERQQGHIPARTGRRRLRDHLARYRLLLAAATLVIAAAAALLATPPWNDSPGFLARAEAALTPPAGTILHMKYEWTFTAKTLGCTVTRGPTEFWIDQEPPYRYRAVNAFVPQEQPGSDLRALLCSPGTLSELGGDSQRTLVFAPPNTLRDLPGQVDLTGNPVETLRDAIREGRAHHEGKAQLDGRTVERIRWDAPPDCPVSGCLDDPTYAYVDPETFYPIRIESPHGYAMLPGRPVERADVVVRYLTYEYLPRTDANLALTDIRAQHPGGS